MVESGDNPQYVWVMQSEGKFSQSPQAYGDRYAAVYDHVYQDFEVPTEQLALLADLAGDGPALELGAGSGRVAVPLASLGVEVTALDTSQAMLDHLVARADAAGVAARVHGVRGDAQDFATGTRFSMAYAPFNFVFLVGDDLAKAHTFANCAKAVVPGGRLVVEAFVPRPGRRLPDGRHPALMPEPGQSIAVKALMDDKTILTASEFEPASGRWSLREIILTHGEPVQVVASDLHCADPDHLDTIAANAGFRLSARYSDWAQTPFDPASSPKHVTIYETQGTPS